MVGELLAKSREINAVMVRQPEVPARFAEIAQVITRILKCSCFIVGRRGIITGYAFTSSTPCTEIEKLIDHCERFPESFNQDFQEILGTKTNIDIGDKRKCIFNHVELKCSCNDKIWAIIPIFSGDGRSGTIVLMRATEPFTTADIILAEHAALLLAVEVSRIRARRIANCGEEPPNLFLETGE